MSDGKSVVLGVAKAADSYQGAALALLEGGSEGAGEAEVVETPAAPALKVVPHTVEDDDAPAPVVKPAEVKKEEPKSRLDKSFERLAAEEAQLRTRSQALQTQAQEIAAYKEKFARFEAATSKKDGLALLAAAGISYSQLANQLLEGKLPDEETHQKATQKDDLSTRVEQLETQLKQAKAQNARGQLFSHMKEVAKTNTERFPHVVALEDEGAALELLENYVQQNNRLPAEDMEASIELAFEALEQKHRKQAERYTKVSPLLTTKGKAPIVDHNKPAVPSGAVSDRVSKTLSNSQVTGPRSLAADEQTQPKDASDYQRAAMALLESSQG